MARVRRRLRGLAAAKRALAARASAPPRAAEAPGAARAARRATAAPRGRPPRQAAKLSYKEQRELDELPARIEALEVEQKALAALLASTELYAEDPVRAEAAQMRYAQIDDELLAALERWETLGAP